MLLSLLIQRNSEVRLFLFGSAVLSCVLVCRAGISGWPIGHEDCIQMFVGKMSSNEYHNNCENLQHKVSEINPRESTDENQIDL